MHFVTSSRAWGTVWIEEGRVARMDVFKKRMDVAVFLFLLCLLPFVYPRFPSPSLLASLPFGLAAFWSPGNLFLVGRQTCPASTPRPASKPAKNLRSIEEKMTPIQLTEAGNLGPRMEGMGCWKGAQGVVEGRADGIELVYLCQNSLRRGRLVEETRIYKDEYS
ncbi:hypothetical protein E2C01_029551 [Portunus trituberculatus]|uniref:Uncharacterized protein n=1 Tax=Portunus trituberculatus TaxID=210409 RepID=A0A5B7EPN0_PORTR|nr:hypothetical protein [Portunus trituberculatus]